MLMAAILAILVLVAATAKAQTSQICTCTRIILDLLNGQRYFGISHVYQGDYYGSPTNLWPMYYTPLAISRYWSQSGISNNQSLLELVQGPASGGAMFWNEYYVGSPVMVSLAGTYTNGSSPVGDGFVIELFLKPTAWSISPEYNYSISYTTTRGEHPSPVAGDLILPQSATPYLVVEWDPYWQIGSGAIVNATGQWNIWIVTNPSGNNPSFSPTPSPNLGSSYAGWDGIGTGTLNPNPGDRILITVTYDPSTNILRGIAYDMSTEQSASFTLDLNGYFTPPTNGNYVFGVGAGTWFAYANWALLHVAVTQQYTPSLTTFTVTKTTTVTIPMTTTVTSTVAVPVTRTSTVTATTTVLSTVTSTITAAIATTTATTITALGGIGVVCWILAAVLAVLLAVVILLWRRSSRTIAIGSMETQVR